MAGTRLPACASSMRPDEDRTSIIELLPMDADDTNDRLVMGVAV